MSALRIRGRLIQSNSIAAPTDQLRKERLNSASEITGERQACRAAHNAAPTIPETATPPRNPGTGLSEAGSVSGVAA